MVQFEDDFREFIMEQTFWPMLSLCVQNVKAEYRRNSCCNVICYFPGNQHSLSTVYCGAVGRKRGVCLCVLLRRTVPKVRLTNGWRWNASNRNRKQRTNKSVRRRRK